ncbi:hypothetical protein [Flectobacillus longus]|uniref:hypothetical protein n=1 Tax=Flectobacillus longus TaxID=2984207 RepID=UPI0024B8770D|nr:hypothetical protein [Flectobacillus longus]MDI9882421.1 hypothetical protein [Flectobacillus longus]
MKIKVDFYDKEQKELIEKNFPKDFELFKKNDGNHVDVSLEDFKTYAYFRHQFKKPNGKHQTFLDLIPLAKNWGHYDTYFELQGDKFVNIYPERIEAADVSEMIGVAGGLAVASAIYGLTQADWTKIPITTAHKDFDFSHISCITDRFINIEAKGSIADDNSVKESSVSNLKANILKKKKDDGFKRKYNYKRDSCIGIITVADKTKNLQSWLVDPTIDDFDSSPEKTKLIKRLYFYHSIFRLISKRSYLSITLANRIKTIELISDYKKLDNIPLLDYSFDKIQINESFINARSRTYDKKIIGSTFLIDKSIYFVGIETDLINSIINQNFDDILSLKTKPSTELVTLFCKISKRREQDITSSENSKIKLKKQQNKGENYIYFDVETDLIKNSSGLCIARQKL